MKKNSILSAYFSAIGKKGGSVCGPSKARSHTSQALLAYWDSVRSGDIKRNVRLSSLSKKMVSHAKS